MVLLYALPVGLVLGLLLGGTLGALRNLRVRPLWIYVAIILQILAFPSGLLPFTTSDAVARVLWLVSFGFLGLGAYANRHLVGVPVVALGMLLNVVAVCANGGHMPVRPEALAAISRDYNVHNNSISLAHPHLAWLVDRWAVPGWLPFGNVYSVGDILIALGGIILIVAAMRPRLVLRLAPHAGDGTAQSGLEGA
jgi:hypothetical protein